MSDPPSKLPVRILALDDDPLVRRAWLASARASPNVTLRAVADEADARAWLRIERYDLVISDLDLGAGHTSEALVRDLVRAGRPVVLVTGDVAAARSLSLGVPVYGKPVALSQILGDAGLG